MKLQPLILLAAWSLSSTAQIPILVTGWQMQEIGKITAKPSVVSSLNFRPTNWYKATVPGTVLTTLVDNKVYPEPLYGENMRAIPESLNKTQYWYRAEVNIPSSYKGRHTW